MNAPVDLKTLSLRREDAAPFSFEEFERRDAARRRRRRMTGWSAAASLAVAGLVSVLAVVTQPRLPAAIVDVPAPLPGMAPAGVREDWPALVNLGRFAVTSEIEDHIALLDAEISAARVYAAPAEQLRRMESAREQLHESLLRVSYAQALLNR